MSKKKNTNQNKEVMNNLPESQPTQYVQHTYNLPQQPTQIVPYQAMPIPPKTNNSRKIIGALIGIGVPVAITAGSVALLMNWNEITNNKNNDKFEEMKRTLNTLSLDVENKASKPVAAITKEELQLIGAVKNDYEVKYDIIFADLHNNVLETVLCLVAKDGTVVDKNVQIKGFKQTNYNKEQLDVAAAIASLRANFNIIPNKENKTNRISSLTNKERLARDVFYNGLHELELDTALPFTQIAKDKEHGVKVDIKQRLNPANDTEIQITATISSGDASQEVSFVIVGFLSQASLDQKQLDDAFAELEKHYKTSYRYFTSEQVSKNQYLTVDNIFQDIKFNFENVKNKLPLLKLEAPTFVIKGDDALEVTINAKHNDATKVITFTVSGFSSLKESYAQELKEFANKIPNTAETRQHTDKLPSKHEYADYLDMFNDLNWHYDEEAKNHNIKITLASGSQNDKNGAKQLTLTFIKHNITYQKTVKVTGFLDEYSYVEYAFKKIKSQYENHELQTHTTNKTPSDVNYNNNDIYYLELDTACNFRKIAELYGFSVVIKPQKNPEILENRGEKQVVLELKYKTYTKELPIIVHGFVTKETEDRTILDAFLQEINSITIKTKNYKNKTSDDPTSAYHSFEDFLNDCEAVSQIKAKDNYKNIVIEGFTTLNNNDSERTVRFNAKLGVHIENVTMKVTGFLGNLAAIDQDLNAIKSKIYHEYTTKLHTTKLATEAKVFYNELQDIDNDLNKGFVELAKSHNAVISIKNKESNDATGTITITLDIVIKDKHYEHAFIIKGFITPIERTNNELEQAIGHLGTRKTVTINTNTLASAVNYDTTNTMLTDIALDFATLAPGVSLEFDPNHQIKNNDDSGEKTVYLLLSKNGVIRPHTLTLNGYLTTENNERAKIAKVIAVLEKQNLQTTLFTNKHVSQVTYSTLEELKTDTRLDLAALANEHNLNITISKQNTQNNGSYQILVTVRSKLIPSIVSEKQLLVTGFLSSEAFEANVLNEYLASFSPNFTTTNHRNELPSSFNYLALIDIINDGAQIANIKLGDIGNKYKNHYNPRQLSLNYINYANPLEHGPADDNLGTKIIKLNITYGTTTKAITFNFSGYASIQLNNHFNNKINELINNLEIILINNGEPTTEGYYTKNIPDNIMLSDISYKTKDGSIIDPKYKVNIIQKEPNNQLQKVDVHYTVSYTENGRTVTSDKQVKPVKTDNVQAVVNNVFNASDFGYIKLQRAHENTKIFGTTLSHFRFGNLLQDNIKHQPKLNEDPDNLTPNYITKPNLPNGMDVEFELVRLESSTLTTNIPPELVEPGKDMRYYLYKKPFKTTFVQIVNNNPKMNVYYVDKINSNNTLEKSEIKLKYNFLNIPNSTIVTYYHIKDLVDQEANTDRYYYAPFGDYAEPFSTGIIKQNRTRLLVNIKYTYLGKTVYKSILSDVPYFQITNKEHYVHNDKHYIYVDYYFNLAKNTKTPIGTNRFDKKML
ncbi:Uncharacterised protein [Mycoplasmopsis californica]|uniref:Lipoprotein 17-related variable surface protein n=1 Tax=Mycoplasmopsis equigenitalium TaxID=114883 RepID=A0ABY5J1T9_9BACT|nr:lipoprotein 17-related variable surface protein [Mycoplasmopsis equigenitalium]UUD36684.1 lipoprotein 17-related variable surface protein [Mycoplasmopsis equigenitalium]VEU69353.1 Uncharacterised protein [Mycoplasmopsis californica]